MERLNPSLAATTRLPASLPEHAGRKQGEKREAFGFHMRQEQRVVLDLFTHSSPDSSGIAGKAEEDASFCEIFSQLDILDDKPRC